MRRKRALGVAIIEFSFALVVLLPLILGTFAVGLNLIRSLATVQLARDAGHMYARGTDFSQPGNQTILATVGSNVGLSTTAGSGTAVVILSTVTYVDKALCASAGKVDSSGNPSGCTNYQQWVFTQRITIGKSSIRSSIFGSPTGTVVVNSTTGKISLSDQATNTGDVASFAVGINPYASVNGNVSGLPSGQVIYIAEAASSGFNLTPYVPSGIVDAYSMF